MDYTQTELNDLVPESTVECAKFESRFFQKVFDVANYHDKIRISQKPLTLLAEPAANMDSAPRMEETMPPLPYSEVVQTPLLKTRRPSIHLRDVVEAYMASKRSGLDGSIHKALNTNDPRVKLDPDRHKWRETETEEINLYATPIL